MSADRYRGDVAGVALAVLLAWSSLAAAQSAPPPPPPPADPHAGHVMPQSGQLPDFIPPLSDEDRRVAFPDVPPHAVHDDVVNWFVLVDQFEWQGGDGRPGLTWDTTGWIGRDVNRFWFRTEGASEDGRLDHGEVHLLYGRAIARWWEVVGGVRQDARPGPAQTWAAVGLQGLAPYWFEVEATAYVGAGGRTQFRFESEYDLLLSERLVLQPLLEVNLHGKADPERGVGAGLSDAEFGLRLRFEVRRELAPYVGVTWGRKFFGTADAARAEGERTSGARVVVGVRVWQ